MLKKIIAALVVLIIGFFAWRGAHSSHEPSAAASPVPVQSMAAPSVSATSGPGSTSGSGEVQPSMPVTSVEGPAAPSGAAVGDDEGSNPMPTDSAPSWPKADNAQEMDLWRSGVTTATAFMKAAARGSSVPEDQWWTQVKPHLSEAAQSSWKGYGSRVPFHKVIGEAAPMPLVDVPASEDLPVWVKTDVGVWIVHTATAEGGTKVVSVESAEGQGM